MFLLKVIIVVHFCSFRTMNGDDDDDGYWSREVELLII